MLEVEAGGRYRLMAERQARPATAPPRRRTAFTMAARAALRARAPDAAGSRGRLYVVYGDYYRDL